jgi:hypothetical protein
MFKMFKINSKIGIMKEKKLNIVYIYGYIL